MMVSAEERRRRIVNELMQHQALSVTDLSERFGVSEVSIRRDLSLLQRDGQLRRIHGGALLAPDVGRDVAPISVIQTSESAAKARIGEAAAALVQPGDRLLFDSGTTVLEVARHLSQEMRDQGNLTAITNSLPIVRELGPAKGIHLILLGGIYLDRYEVVVGPSAVTQLSALHADRIFLGADGITFAHGITNANVLEAEVDRSAIAAASQIIVVADSRKIGLIGLTTLMPVAEIDLLITDTGAPEEFVAQLDDLGVQVMLV